MGSNDNESEMFSRFQRSISNMTTAVGNWYRFANPLKAAESERRILARGGIDFTNTKAFTQQLVTLSDPLKAINTVVIDQKDVEESAKDRKNIVICHGFGTGLGFFYQNLSPLSQKIPNSRIYAIDWLGMGRSSRPPFPIYYSGMASARQASAIRQEGIGGEDGDVDNYGCDENGHGKSSIGAVDFFLDSFEEWRTTQAGLEQFTLIGHSLGGYLAALYALKYPQRVTKLILASPVGLPIGCREEGENTAAAVTGHTMPSWFCHLWKANYTPQWAIRMLGPMGRRFIQGYIDKRMPHLEKEEALELGEYMYQIFVDKESGEYALNAILAPGAWAREPLHDKLSKIAMPTCFLYGESDWMDYEHAVEAAELMTVPRCIIKIPNAGHQLYIDNAEEFNRIVSEQVLG